MNDNRKQIKFYKGICLEQIYDHMLIEGTKMSKYEVDKEMKRDAEFPYKSCANEMATKDDLGNLIVWAFIYGDEKGIYVDYPEDPLDKLLELNWNR